MTTPQAPALATVAGVELGTVGYWNISNWPDWHPSADDMAHAIAALDCPAVRRPVLKFGHTGEPGKGDPAIGLIDNLRLTDDGQTLIGDFVGVPAWLAESDDEGRSVLASAYPDRSGEWSHNFQCQLGHTHPFVLHAMALLGVIRPGIGTLESLYDLYTKAPEKEVAVANSAVALAGTTADQVRSAYYNGPAATNYALWIREMYVDPPELIVQDDNNDNLIRVSYSVSGDGNCEFGEGQPVKVEYVNASASTKEPIVAFASKTEARTLITPSTSPAQAGVEQEKEGTMPTPSNGLAQLLGGLAETFGIAPDADDDTAREALKAHAARSEDTSTQEESTEADESEQVAAASASPGVKTVTVSASVWDEMQRKAEAGAEARQLQIAEAHEQTIQEALKDGKILPREAKDWKEALASTPDQTRKLLDGMPKNRAIATTSTGHSIEPADDGIPDDLSWFDTADTAPANQREDA